MPRHNVGRSLESLLRSVVDEAVQGIKSTLPSAKQVEDLQERMRLLDRRVTTLLRRKGRQAGPGKVGRPRQNPAICTVRGCASPARARALCSRHYQQRRRNRLAKK